MNRQGIERRKVGDDVDAQKLFQQTYELFHSPRSAAQLGLAEQAVGRWEDAEQHVSESLNATKDPWIEKYRLTLEQSLSLIRQHVARVEINGSPAGAEVLVNGRVAGRLPLPSAVAVSAGDVDILCRADGHKSAARKVTLIASQYERVFIRLEELGSTNVTHGATASRVVDSTAAGAASSVLADEGEATSKSAGGVGSTSLSMRKAIKWTALGVAGLGLAAGVIASISRSHAVDDFVATRGGTCRDRNGVGVDQSGQPAADCQRPLDAIDTAKTFQLVGFVTAAVLGATWLALQLSEPSAGPAASSQTALASRHSGAISRTRDSAVTRAFYTWDCLPGIEASSPGLTCGLRF